jgi:uncharacterized protein
LKVSATTWALASFACILAAIRFGVARSTLALSLGERLPFAFASFALLLAPLWFFGFGAGAWLRAAIHTRPMRIAMPALLGIPYLVFALPTGNFHLQPTALMFALPMVLAALLELAPVPPILAWQDALVMAVLVATYMLRLLAPASPYGGLAVLPKLFVADLALYLYLVVRKLEGIGYSLIPTRHAFLIGLREWFYFLPFGLGLGAALRFIHFHSRLSSAAATAGGLLTTFLLVAVPEELFFRGILQNLLETRFSRRVALLMAAILFGLAHFNRGVSFNWRYVLLATIAGIFYGRAWRAQRQLLASVVSHTAVDVVWSLWFR